MSKEKERQDDVDLIVRISNRYANPDFDAAVIEALVKSWFDDPWARTRLEARLKEIMRRNFEA